MEKQMKFAKGLRVKEVGKYGDIKLSISSSDLFCDENNFDPKTGWGNFLIKKSKNGNLYIIIDEWKPTKTNKENENIVKFEEVKENDTSENW